MEVTRNPYYRVNKYLLSSTGQWPYQTKFQKIFLSSISYAALLSLLVTEIFGLIKSWGDIDTTIECFTPMVVLITSIVLITNNIYNMDKIKKMSFKIEEDWTTLLATPEVEILHTYARKGQIMTITFSSCLFFCMFIYLDVPIVPQFLDLILPLNESRPKKAVYNTEYYLDEENNFYWIYMHGYIATIVNIIIIVGVDSMLMLSIQHACGILAILGFRLETRVKTDNNFTNIYNISSQELLHTEISFCAKMHKRVIIFISDICDCYSTAYFLMLGFNMSVVSVTGYQTVMKLNNPTDVMRFGSFTFSQIFHLFCISVPCQQLIDHSISVADSIYNGYWYELPTESQKLLLIIMSRGLEPCTFTAGKLYIFSMTNFASILRTSMSCFTVLSSTRG